MVFPRITPEAPGPPPTHQQPSEDRPPPGPPRKSCTTTLIWCQHGGAQIGAAPPSRPVGGGVAPNPRLVTLFHTPGGYRPGGGLFSPAAGSPASAVPQTIVICPSRVSRKSFTLPPPPQDCRNTAFSVAFGIGYNQMPNVCCDTQTVKVRHCLNSFTSAFACPDEYAVVVASVPTVFDLATCVCLAAHLILPPFLRRSEGRLCPRSD